MSLLYFYRNATTYIILGVVNLVSYAIFTTKLTFIVYVLFGIIYVFISKTKINDNKHRRIRCFFEYLPLVLFLFNIVVAYGFRSDNAVMNLIDIAFGNRLSFSKAALHKIGLSLFGKSFNMAGIFSVNSNLLSYDSYFYIDNNYIYIMLRYGIVFTALTIGIYVAISKIFLKVKDCFHISWVVAMLFFAISNSCLINIEFNPMIFIGYKMIEDYYLNTRSFRLKYINRQMRYKYRKQ